MALDKEVRENLQKWLDRSTASNELMTSAEITRYTGTFAARFGPAVLSRMDGEVLLNLLHGRQDRDARPLVYWLEFKNDDEFPAKFGSIAGGSALKFGIFQKSTGVWMGDARGKPQEITLDTAISIARRQRDELVAGSNVLAEMDGNDVSDRAYDLLQKKMEQVAPSLFRAGWAHKYWFLLNSEKIDDYHNPNYQRFHIIKLLQMPPDSAGIRDFSSPRFLCAGRFMSAARELGTPVANLTKILNLRNRSMHGYWRVGTTSSTGESQWPIMLAGNFVSIGWSEVPDLVPTLAQQESPRDHIKSLIQPSYPGDEGTASRKAGEILNFAGEIAEHDFVLACEGRQVLGVGRVAGAYEYDPSLAFPHKRPVEWLLLERWSLPENEGPQTTVFQMGRYAANLLEIERRLFRRDPADAAQGKATNRQISDSPPSAPLPALDPIASRAESILRRKGQVILYGPPGTGKTYHALRAARELASRRAFGKAYAALAPEEKSMLEGAAGLVRVCSFHPGYSYEDFVRGLRPNANSGTLLFEPRDGIFRRLCSDAEKRPEWHFFLVVDEINRGDVPRIFGELLTALELDKRGLPIVLPDDDKPLSIPDNVFILGTMNTADRSVSLLDAALRRRFGFIELMPDSTVLGSRQVGGLPLGAWLDALNARIRDRLKRDGRNLQIGHAYLLPKQPIVSVADFARVLRDEIVPLLEEYCYDDFAALQDILGKGMVDTERSRIRSELFDANREDELMQAIYSGAELEGPFNIADTDEANGEGNGGSRTEI